MKTLLFLCYLLSYPFPRVTATKRLSYSIYLLGSSDGRGVVRRTKGSIRYWRKRLDNIYNFIMPHIITQTCESHPILDRTQSSFPGLHVLSQNL